MTDSDDASSSVSSVANVNQVHEYYEEVDHQILDLRKQKNPTSISAISFVKETPRAIDPVKKLNEELNRQFRPDLIPPSPSRSLLLPEAIVERAPLADPLIFDARAKPVKPSKKKKEDSISTKQTLLTRRQQLAEPSSKSTYPFKAGMYNQQTNFDGYQVPPGMVLVAAPQEQAYPRVIEPSHQQQSYPRVIEPSHQQQPHPIVSQYTPSAVVHSNSFKNNRIAPPPSAYQVQPVNHMLQNSSFQAPSSMLSTNQLLLQSSYLSQQQQQQQHYQQQQQQQPIFKHIDQSKTSKKKQKKQSDEKQSHPKNANKSIALYNQQNGRIEGVVKNRLKVVSDDTEESKIIDDDDDEPKGKWSLWLSQPLCLGLSRLTGGILFGAMILLGCGSIAGLIASIVLYSQDSVNNAQWKILGMVVCAIMLITIIITLVVFIYCYKNGYMFDDNEDLDPTDRSTAQDAEGNEQQKAVLRKIYKFNRPNETPPVPPRIATPPPRQPPSYIVSDKQTNTETTIAPSRPNDIERGVWPSINAYGGIAYRPLIVPRMTSTFIQVFPHEIEQAMQPQHITYQVVAPTAAIPPPQIQPKIIQATAPPPPPPPPPVVEVVQTKSKPQPKVMRASTPESSVIEYVEPRPKQPRIIQIPVPETPAVEIVGKKSKQQPRIIHMSSPESSVVEYIETTQKQTRRNNGRQAHSQKIFAQPTTHIEYVDVEEEQRGHRAAPRQQYEIVEEVSDRSASESPVEEIVEIVDASKHKRHRGRKKEKKHGFGKVSIKHMKSSR